LNTTSTTIQAIRNDGLNVTLSLEGNITSQQITGTTISVNETAHKTTIGFTVTGIGGTLGFGNITVPKSVVPYGTTPTVDINNQKAQNQGYTQDADNYYVWYTTHFSRHYVSLVFSENPQNPNFSLLTVAVLAVLVVPAFAFVIVLRMRKKLKA
jgi:hypothetical protein